MPPPVESAALQLPRLVFASAVVPPQYLAAVKHNICLFTFFSCFTLLLIAERSLTRRSERQLEKCKTWTDVARNHAYFVKDRLYIFLDKNASVLSLCTHYLHSTTVDAYLVFKKGQNCPNSVYKGPFGLLKLVKFKK